mmetsp:Transcript_15092/g.23641  ORF Transcript_15092/g.23641 Transcript_15092/m.23641 type:complete len:220 (-) Transcript_15092:694-1353(-)
MHRNATTLQTSSCFVIIINRHQQIIHFLLITITIFILVTLVLIFVLHFLFFFIVQFLLLVLHFFFLFLLVPILYLFRSVFLTLLRIIVRFQLHRLLHLDHCLHIATHIHFDIDLFHKSRFKFIRGIKYRQIVVCVLRQRVSLHVLHRHHIERMFIGGAFFHYYLGFLVDTAYLRRLRMRFLSQTLLLALVFVLVLLFLLRVSMQYVIRNRFRRRWRSDC